MGDFPILQRTVHGKRLVYLDNAATTQKPRVVIDTMTEYYEQFNANVARGVHVLAEESTTIYESARKAVADFLGVQNEQVIFTAGATDSLNFVANWAESELKPGDEILLSIFEHHANIVPWQALAEKTGAKIIFTGMTKDYQFDMQDFTKKLNTKTKIVAVSHVSNVLGTVLPITDIAAAAHERNAFVVVDGAQAVGHMPVDVTDLGADFYSFSAHKMYGPQGIGVLAVKQELLDTLSPFRFGGGMISKVDVKGYSLGEIPQRFEAGTPNVAGAVGLHAAITFLKGIGFDKLHEQEERLSKYAVEQLGKIAGVKIYAPSTSEGIISFDVKGIHPHDVAQVLDDHGVAIRSGMHCAMPLHDALGIEALNRVSLAIYNTKADIDVLVASLNEARTLFGGDA